jgi:hypothetical protein
VRNIKQGFPYVLFDRSFELFVWKMEKEVTWQLYKIFMLHLWFGGDDKLQLCNTPYDHKLETSVQILYVLGVKGIFMMSTNTVKNLWHNLHYKATERSPMDSWDDCS